MHSLPEALGTLRRIVKNVKCNFLMPIGEWTLIPVSEYREEFSKYVKVPLVSHETVMKTIDKSLTIKIATEEGVPTPTTLIPSNLRELDAISRKVTYPTVIKPRTSWVWNDDGKALFRRASYVSSPGELVSVYKTIHKDFPFPMIQEYIPGKTYDVAAILNHSKLRAICCIEEDRAHPPMGGYSSFRKSVKLDPKMRDYALRLLKALKWHGVAEVEFKMDPRDSVPKLMEINGRFWGSLEVAIAAGIDFPYLFYKLIVDGDIPTVPNYKIGVKRRWLEGDILHLTSVMRSNFCNGIEHPERWSTIRAFLKFYEKNMSYDTFSKDDPMPFISSLFFGDIPGVVQRKMQRILRKYLPKSTLNSV